MIDKIDKAVYEYLASDKNLAARLTRYADHPAVFYQEAPPDVDPLWEGAPQYGRLVFSIDTLGDATRVMGGNLAIDVQCIPGRQSPEELEGIVRRLMDGCFFSSETETIAAQWTDSRAFTDPTDQVCGITLSFSLLAFPVLTTEQPNVIARMNQWTAEHFPSLSVINYNNQTGTWKPNDIASAIYWRVLSVRPANWIADSWQTVWRTALVRGHTFTARINTSAALAHEIICYLYQEKRLLQSGETPIMVGQNNQADSSADALRTGQLTIEATFAQIIRPKPSQTLQHIHYV